MKGLLEQMDAKVKKWQSEVSTVRTANGQLTAESAKYRARVDLLEGNAKALESRNKSLEVLFEQTKQERLDFEEKSRGLKNQVDEHVISRAAFEKNTQVVREDAARKNRMLEN